MNVTMRTEHINCFVDVDQIPTKTMSIEDLDRAIRQLQVARKWLIDELARRPLSK